MPIVFEQAPPEVHVMAQEVIQTHHADLRFPGGEYVRLCILFASNDDKENGEPAVKCHGYPCAALISVIPYKQRVDKRADAEIIIDAEHWDTLTEPQQRALLDHEITHLEVQIDEHGCVKTDDMGRPKLKLRLHNWQLGGFAVIAERYGADAPEVVEARKFQERYGKVALKREEEKMFA